MWTVSLVATGVLGILLVPYRPMLGWTLYFVNEVLWALYALHTHDHPLFVMAWIWGAAGVRNWYVSHKREKTAWQRVIT